MQTEQMFITTSEAAGMLGQSWVRLNQFKPPQSNFELITVPMAVLLMWLSVSCFSVSFCTVSPSVCLHKWPPFGQSCSFGQPCVLFVMSICNFGCFPFWFPGQDLGSDCSVPGHYLPFTFHLLFQLYCYVFADNRI